MKQIKLELNKIKETKGTFVYGSDKEDAPIPSVYIKKAAFPDGAPAKIKLTIEE